MQRGTERPTHNDRSIDGENRLQTCLSNASLIIRESSPYHWHVRASAPETSSPECRQQPGADNPRQAANEANPQIRTVFVTRAKLAADAAAVYP